MSVARCLRYVARRAYNSSMARRKIQHSGASSYTTQAELTVTNGGRQLRAVWKEAWPSVYHAIWLRHNCQCSSCLCEHSNQLSIQPHELDPQVKILDLKLKDEDVKIKWSCGHEGHLNLDWLKRHCYSQKSLEQRRQDNHPTLPRQAVLPVIKSEELENERGVLRWLKHLSECGMCLVTGVPCTDEGGLELTQKVTLHLQETFYGGYTVVKVNENPNSISYGPNELEPHMDVPEYESHPGLNFFQCIRNDECVEGGESIVVDCLAVMEQLRITHPHHFATLVRVPVTFQRIHYKSSEEMVLLIYGVIVADTQIKDFPVDMVYQTPHIHLNKHGEIVKLRWSPHNHGPLQVPEEDVLPYYEAFACVAKSVSEDLQFQICYKLKPGDVLTVNNHRMLHGRTSIKLNGGIRQLNNFTLNIDEFKSRLRVLCAKYDPDYQPKRILNHDFSSTAAAQAGMAETPA